jgi:NTP pyrophosphatase (non-canonical NTP hydrolase)
MNHGNYFYLKSDKVLIIKKEINPIKLVKKELKRAKLIHPFYPKNIFKQLAIMQEEAGEVAKAVNDYHYQAGGTIQDVKDELIQTAAMCIRMYENL